MGSLRAALILAVMTLSGCLSHTLVLHPKKHANHDRRFYIVVRAVKDQEFYTDGYERIAEMVFAPQLDPSVKLVQLISPGHEAKVKIKLQGDQTFGVYALFTEPSDAWKVQVQAPLKQSYHLVVEGNRLHVRGEQKQRSDGSGIDGDKVKDAGGSALELAGARQ